MWINWCTLYKRAFARRYNNLVIPELKLQVKWLLAVLVASLEQGLEVFNLYDKNINTEIYLDAISPCDKFEGTYAVFGGGIPVTNLRLLVILKSITAIDDITRQQVTWVQPIPSRWASVASQNVTTSATAN